MKSGYLSQVMEREKMDYCQSYARANYCPSYGFTSSVACNARRPSSGVAFSETPWKVHGRCNMACFRGIVFHARGNKTHGPFMGEHLLFCLLQRCIFVTREHTQKFCIVHV